MKKLLVVIPGLIAWGALIIVAMPIFAQAQLNQERIDNRRAEQQVFLDEARRQRIANQCQNTQATLSTQLSSASDVKANRESAYASSKDTLTAIATRLEASGLDVAVLTSQIGQYDALIAQLLADLDIYIAALTDASAMDCVNDVEGFVAAIQDARGQLVALKAQSLEIRSYLTVTIAETIESYKTQLDSTQEG